MGVRHHPSADPRHHPWRDRLASLNAVTSLAITDVNVVDILELRRRVLRTGTPSADPRLPQDDAPGVFHLAGRLRDGGPDAVVACVSFIPQPIDQRPGASAWRFRAMAVDTTLQGAGHGRQILTAGIERVRAAGGRAVWCHTRDRAQGFYGRLGMVVEGEGFIDADTAMPHHVMVLDL